MTIRLLHLSRAEPSPPPRITRHRIQHPNPRRSISLKRVIADGEYVAFHHHFQMSADDRGASVVDIFRVQDGKVVEHWDVIQPIPEKSANDNTMFRGAMT